MITASIVTYNHHLQDIEPALKSLLMSPVERIYIIDHTENDNKDFISNLTQYGKTMMTQNAELRQRCIKGNLQLSYHKHENLGYGSGHNAAINLAKSIGSKYHIVVNPDVWFDSSVIPTLREHMENHKEVGQIMPRVLFPDGQIQRLCKLLPTPWNMFSRLCMPPLLIHFGNSRYELRDTEYNKIINVPYLSGCFMFFRMSALEKVGLFDEHFFMYAEDIDMTRRMHQEYNTIFYPDATIYHRFSRASRHSFKLLLIHIGNIFMYFNKWGWFFDAERRKINKDTLRQIRLLRNEE